MSDTNTEAETEAEGDADPADAPEGQSLDDLVAQAEQYHDLLDEAKAWSMDFERQINADSQDAETDDEDRQALREAAWRIGSVARRIKTGDENIVRGR